MTMSNEMIFGDISIVPLLKAQRKFELFRKLTGEREAARRIDYR